MPRRAMASVTPRLVESQKMKLRTSIESQRQDSVHEHRSRPAQPSIWESRLQPPFCNSQRQRFVKLREIHLALAEKLKTLSICEKSSARCRRTLTHLVC